MEREQIMMFIIYIIITYQGVSKEPTDVEIHSFSFPPLCIDPLKHSDAEAR